MARQHQPVAAFASGFWQYEYALTEVFYNNWHCSLWRGAPAYASG